MCYAYKFNVENIRRLRYAVRMAQKFPDLLKAMRHRAGLTMAEMARAAGLKGASSWQRYESVAFTKDFLPPEVTVRLADHLAGRGTPPITAEEVLALGRSALVEAASAGVGPARASADGVAGAAVEAVQSTEDPGPADQADSIPVYGAARGGDDQEMHLDGRPIDWVPRPPFLRNVRQAYSMQVVGDSMKPMYRAGQLVYVNPFRLPRPENGVVIYKHNGAVLVKELVRRSATRLTVKEYQPREREFSLPIDEIQAIHTVVGSREQ